MAGRLAASNVGRDGCPGRTQHGLGRASGPLLAAALLLGLLGACAGGSGDPGGATTGSQSAGASGEPGASTTHLDGVDACSLLEPDEVRTFVEANREAVLMPGSQNVEITEVRAGAPEPGGNCVWELETFDREMQEQCIDDGGSAENCDVGEGGAFFRIQVIEHDNAEGCLVESDGICVFVPHIGGAPDVEIPPGLEDTIRARLTK